MAAATQLQAEAKAEAKRARIRQEECDEILRQIHLVRDELESVGDRAQELLGKLYCGRSKLHLHEMHGGASGSKV